MEVKDTFWTKEEQDDQMSSISSEELLIDAFSYHNNNELDKVQITNIGKGMYSTSPFSSITGGTNINEGFDRIDQALKVIMHTSLKEVPMLPILGSDVDKILFEQIDEITIDALEISLKRSFQTLEPRVKISSMEISMADRDNNKINVFVEYVLTNTNMVHRFKDTIYTDNGGDVE